MAALARLVLTVSVFLVLAALGDLVLRDRSIEQLGEPRWTGERVQALAVDLPPIQPFAYYYGGEEDSWRNLNPFVPFNEREIERQRLDSGRRREQVIRTVPRPQPPQNPEIEIPVRELPPLAEAATIQVPEVLGRMVRGDEALILVRYDDRLWRMRVGEALQGWSLVAIEAGAVVLHDEHGEEWRVRIGSSDAPIANRLPDQASTTATPAPGGTSADPGGTDPDAPPPQANDPLIEQIRVAAAEEDFDRLMVLLPRTTEAQRTQLLQEVDGSQRAALEHFFRNLPSRDEGQRPPQRGR